MKSNKTITYKIINVLLPVVIPTTVKEPTEIRCKKRILDFAKKMTDKEREKPTIEYAATPF